MPGACFSSSVHHALMPSSGGGGPTLRQFAQVATPGDGQTTQQVTLANVLAGSAVVVFVTEYNIGGSPPGSATPSAITVTDTAGNTYALLDVINCYPPSSDLQAVMSFWCPDVPAASSLTITATYVGLEWQGVLAVEVSGVPASPTMSHGGNYVTGAVAGSTDAIVGPGVAVGAVPTLVLAMSMDSAGLMGNPLAGTGYTDKAEVWNWLGAEGSANWTETILETKTTSSAGTVTPTFTPSPWRGAGVSPDGSTNDNFVQLVVTLAGS